MNALLKHSKKTVMIVEDDVDMPIAFIKTQNIPMILSSGHADINEKSQKMGARSCLLKPFSTNSFLVAVNKYM